MEAWAAGAQTLRRSLFIKLGDQRAYHIQSPSGINNNLEEVKRCCEIDKLSNPVTMP